MLLYKLNLNYFKKIILGGNYNYKEEYAVKCAEKI